MSTPLKILLVHSDESNQLLHASAVLQHLQVAFARLTDTQVSADCIPVNNSEKRNFSEADQIIFLHNRNFDANSFFKKLNTDVINKYILLIPDENFPAISLEFEIKQYNFFDIDPETGIKRNYNENDPLTSIHYWSGILDIAFDILAAQKKLQKSETIFIAETTPDLYQYRNAVCSELVHRGYNILPRQSLFGNADEITALISKYLDISIMSVHLIGSNYGKQIPGSDNSIIELQCRLAAKKWRLSSQQDSNSQFNRIIWLPPGIKAADDRQQRFLDTLRIEDKNDASEILQVPLEDLKAVLRTKILELTHQIKDNKNGKKTVYLIHEPGDWANVQEIIRYLGNQGFEVLYISPDIEAGKIVSKHLEFLTYAAAALIYDNDCSVTWVKSKMKDLIKAPGYGRSKPFTAKALWTKNGNKYLSLTENNDTFLLSGTQNIEEACKPFLTKLNLEQ